MAFTEVFRLIPRRLTKKNPDDLESSDFFHDQFMIHDGNYWNHTVTTEKGIKLQLSLNPTEKLIEIIFLDIPEDISTQIAPPLSGYKNVPLWMFKHTAEVREGK